MTNCTTLEESGLLQDDLRELLQLLGMPDGAQPRSPHEVFQSALQELRRVLSANPCGGWPSEEVERIARILDPIAFIKVKAVEAGKGDLSIVRYQNRCSDARKLAGEVLAALPRPPSEWDAANFAAAKAAVEAVERTVAMAPDYRERIAGAVYRAIRSLPRPPSDGWLKMESAPTDGMPILAVIEDQRGRRHVEIVSWAGAWTPYDRHPICWQHIPDPPERVSHSTMLPGNLPSEIK